MERKGVRSPFSFPLLLSLLFLCLHPPGARCQADEGLLVIPIENEGGRPPPLQLPDLSPLYVAAPVWPSSWGQQVVVAVGGASSQNPYQPDVYISLDKGRNFRPHVRIQGLRVEKASIVTHRPIRDAAGNRNIQDDILCLIGGLKMDTLEPGA